MGICSTCGSVPNPTEPIVVGPAVILGNGTTIPFPSDDAARAYIERKLARGADPMILVPAGETHA